MRIVPSRTKPYRFIAPICLCVGVLFSWATAGCGGSAASEFCNNKCDCEQNCSTSARESCIKVGDDNIKTAETVGCGDQANSAADCLNSGSQCIGGKYQTGGCDPQNSKLEQCLLSAKCSFLADGSIHCL